MLVRNRLLVLNYYYKTLLCRVASCQDGGSQPGLGDYLKAAGWKNIGTDPSDVQAGCIVAGDAGYGQCTHAGD